MSFDNTPDPNRAKVAPPPPPPAEVAMGASANQSQGFNPHAGKMALEVSAAIFIVAVLGAGIIFAGGTIAAWMTPWVSIEVDKTIGEAAQEQYASTEKDCSRPEMKQYVEELAEPLIQAAGDVPFDFTFRVADTDQINAFALPGGYVTVNRGLLEAAETGEEVAGVIGHEIQHAILRHGTERMLRQLGSSALVALILGGTDFQGVGHAAGRLTSLAYDRDQESEADERGVKLMVQSKMDPRGLARIFERLSKDSVQPPELLSTHPDPGDRAALVAQASRGGDFVKVRSPVGLKCN